jgi:hypothetical protein
MFSIPRNAGTALVTRKRTRTPAASGIVHMG